MISVIPKPRIVLAVTLAISGLFLSGILIMDKYDINWGSEVTSRLCGAGEEIACDTVNNSEYSTFGGLSLAAAGVFFYGSLLALLLLVFASGQETSKASAFVALGLVGLALLVDVVLLGLQVFAIGTLCLLCLMTYVVNVGMLVTLLPWRGEGVSIAMLSQKDRRLLGSWFVASVLVFISTGFVDLGFSGMENERGTKMLGNTLETEALKALEAADLLESEMLVENQTELPTPNSADTRNQFAHVRQQLNVARNEVQRLQSILDDPERYREYQTERLVDRFQNAPIENLSLDGVPFKGPEGAPIKVVEYSDFLCPFCRNLANAFSNFIPKSGGQIAIYFKNYPLDQECNPAITKTVHEGACELALGAVCAEDQGKFWDFHDYIFSEPAKDLTLEGVVRLAGSAGLDQDIMQVCMGSKKARKRLAQDIDEAKRLGVAATPTVYINGKKLDQINGFLNAVESEYARLGLLTNN